MLPSPFLTMVTNVKLQKGELSEQTAKSRAGTIRRLKAAWEVSELVDIFPKEIRPKDDLGSSTLINLRTISNLCPDLKNAQKEMLDICESTGGSLKPFNFSQSRDLLEKLKKEKNMVRFFELSTH